MHWFYQPYEQIYWRPPPSPAPFFEIMRDLNLWIAVQHDWVAVSALNELRHVSSQDTTISLMVDLSQDICQVMEINHFGPLKSTQLRSEQVLKCWLSKPTPLFVNRQGSMHIWRVIIRCIWVKELNRLVWMPWTRHINQFHWVCYFPPGLLSLQTSYMNSVTHLLFNGCYGQITKCSL